MRCPGVPGLSPLALARASLAACARPAFSPCSDQSNHPHSCRRGGHHDAKAAVGQPHQDELAGARPSDSSARLAAAGSDAASPASTPPVRPPTHPPVRPPQDTSNAFSYYAANATWAAELAAEFTPFVLTMANQVDDRLRAVYMGPSAKKQAGWVRRGVQLAAAGRCGVARVGAARWAAAAQACSVRVTGG